MNELEIAPLTTAPVCTYYASYDLVNIKLE